MAEALTQSAHEYPGWAPAIAAIRPLVLTGCRKQEILKLRWDEVDLQGRCLRLSASKTGPKVVFLNTAARAPGIASPSRPSRPRYYLSGFGSSETASKSSTPTTFSLAISMFTTSTSAGIYLHANPEDGLHS